MILWISNGWSVAPHCWRTYIRHPLKHEHYHSNIYVLTILGVAIFYEVRHASR